MIPGGTTDFILNGAANGSVAKRLLATGWNLDAFRTWHEKDGQSYMQIVGPDGKPVAKKITVNDATMAKDEWLWMDRTVREVSRQRRAAVADLLGRPGQVVNLTNPMGTPLIQYQSRSTGTPAKATMDGLTKGQRDKLLLDLKTLPIPLIFKDFSYSLRELETSRRTGEGLDDAGIIDATEQVWIYLENLLIGGSNYTFTYGDGTLYGYTTFPQRLTGSLDDPAGGGWVGDDLLQNLIAMRTALYSAKHYGPYMVYVGPGWDAYLDRDFSMVKGEISVRNRMLQIEKIAGIRTLDFLPSTDVVMVEMNSRTVRMFNGFEPRVIKWAEEGGEELIFKVVACMAPNLRADYYGNTGIAHYTVA